MKTLILMIVLAWPVNVRAQDFCSTLWDMALVARAAAEEGIAQESIVRVLKRIYNAPAGLTDALASMALLDTHSALLFANKVKRQCDVQFSQPRVPI